MMSNLIRAVCALASCGFVCVNAAAQSFPAKPVRALTSSPLGSSGDIALRLIAARLGTALGHPLVVETRPGANGAVSVAALRAAPPDGHTVLWTTSSVMVTAPFLVKNLPYDPLTDVTHVSLVVDAPMVLVVHSGLPVSSTSELIEHAKRNPGQFAYGSAGVGSVAHLVGESIASATGVQLIHVPYNAGNTATPRGDLVTGRLHMYFPSPGVIAPYLRTGEVKVLAVFLRSRLKRLPDVPTIYESMPNYTNVPSWFGFVAPLRTPQPVIARLQAETARAANGPDVAGKLEEMGMAIVASTAEAMLAQMRDDMDSIARMIKTLGIQPQ